MCKIAMSAQQFMQVGYACHTPVEPRPRKSGIPIVLQLDVSSRGRTPSL
jgi:hypothetical protein